MNAKFIALTAKLAQLFQRNNPQNNLALDISKISSQEAVKTKVIERPTPDFFTKMPEELTLVERYQKAQTEHLKVRNLVPQEGQSILANLEKNFKQIPSDKLQIHHRIRLKHMTELVLPHIFKEYTFFKVKKTDNGIPADTYFIENLKIAQRQVQDILTSFEAQNDFISKNRAKI